MKKIFLYAYDHVNLGDDLFIETIVNRYPDTEFYFWTDNENKKVFQEQMNLKIIDQDSGKIKLLNKIVHHWLRDIKLEFKKNVMHKYILVVRFLWNIQPGKILYHGGIIKVNYYLFLF